MVHDCFDSCPLLSFLHCMKDQIYLKPFLYVVTWTVTLKDGGGGSYLAHLLPRVVKGFELPI